MVPSQVVTRHDPVDRATTKPMQRQEKKKCRHARATATSKQARCCRVCRHVRACKRNRLRPQHCTLAQASLLARFVLSTDGEETVGVRHSGLERPHLSYLLPISRLPAWVSERKLAKAGSVDRFLAAVPVTLSGHRCRKKAIDGHSRSQHRPLCLLQNGQKPGTHKQM